MARVADREPDGLNNFCGVAHASKDGRVVNDEGAIKFDMRNDELGEESEARRGEGRRGGQRGDESQSDRDEGSESGW